MSVSLQDVISIVMAIKQCVDRYHSNNAICQELARVSSRIGAFVTTNLKSLELRLNDPVLTSQIRELTKTLNEILEEITKYEGKGFIKHLIKASKYNDRFKTLVLALQSNQEILQTILSTHVALSVLDVQKIVDRIDQSDIIQDCDMILEKFNNEISMLISDSHDKVVGMLELRGEENNELKNLMSIMLRNTHTNSNSNSNSIESQIDSFMNAVNSLKSMAPRDVKHFARKRITSAISHNTNTEMSPDLVRSLDYSNSIGSGTFGVVFPGKLIDNTAIAAKVLKGRTSNEDKEGFLKEISVLTSFNGNDNILYCYGWFTINDSNNHYHQHIAMVTEYCESSLKARIHDSNNYNDMHLIDKWMGYAYQIANGMEALSRRGVIHRDLKVENCLIASNGTLKICDFGLALTRDTINRMSTTSFLQVASQGTLGYIAPERLAGRISDASDVYSYGIIIAYMLSNEFPWVDNSGTILGDAIISNMIKDGRLPSCFDDFTEANYPELKRDVILMLKQCCAKDSYERPRFLELKRLLTDPFVPNSPRSPRNSSKISRNVNPPLPSPAPAPVPAPAPTPAPIIITPPVTKRVTNHAIGKNLLFDGLITTSGNLYEGKLFYPPGHERESFEGTFINDQPLKGKLIYSNGSTYDGSFNNDKRNGYGQYNTGGYQYTGTWKDDKCDGHGISSYDSGNVYEGEYCDGQRHGQGRYVKADGTVVHDGRWNHNEAKK